MLAATALAVALVGSPGCASAPAVAPPAEAAEMTDAELLHAAIGSVFEERGLGVALDSERFSIVTSEWETVQPDLRRRLVGSVIEGPQGAMGLNLRAEYERRATIDGQPQWRPLEGQALAERAKAIELEVGRAIEKRYRSWKEVR